MPEMRLNPLEIRQHRFHTRLRGFDPGEVDTFLEAVVSDYEDVVRENARLRQETEELRREVARLRSKETSIQETLTTAQQVVEGLKQTAIKEAEIRVSEAQVTAVKLLHDAEEHRQDLRRDILELEQLRNRAEDDVCRDLERTLSTIQALRETRTPRAQETGRQLSRSPRPRAPAAPRSDPGPRPSRPPLNRG